MRPPTCVLFVSALIMMTGAPAGATLIYEYDAAQDPDGGADSSWEPNTVNAGAPGRDWSLSGTSYNNSVTSQTTLTASYSFDGDNSNTSSTSSFGNTPVGGGGGQSDASASTTFEVWARPDRDNWDDVSDESLFESGGGNGAGLRFGAASGGAQVRFQIGENFNGVGVTVRSHTLTDADDAALLSDFIQIAGVYDPAASNQSRLYVNGELVDSATDSGRQDWQRGGQVSGLGSVADDFGSLNDTGGIGTFRGEIALLRLYDEPLSDNEVRSAYTSVIPEPGALTLLAPAGLLALRRGRGAGPLRVGSAGST